MKYIKKYENILNPRLNELKKLISHLIKIFENMGYRPENWLSGIYAVPPQSYESDFVKNGEKCFQIKGDYSTKLIIFSIILRVGSLKDGLSKFLPEYFKTIDGLNLYSEDRDWFSTTFEIVDNIDNIIPQITAEDIELKFEGKKFNL